MRTILIAILALLGSSAATAQEWQVSRESFAFAGHRLTIYVDSETAGTLRVMRGAPGSVRVAGRAPMGFTAAGLAEHDALTLTAAGAGPVDYMVAVPHEVWVQVRLPGRALGEAMSGHTRARTFSWGEAADRGGAVDHSREDALPPIEAGAHHPSLLTTLTRDLAPAVVSLPELANVASISVHIEVGPFRVLSSRPLSVAAGAPDRLEIRPAAPPLDLVLTVPAGTRSFRLLTGGDTALVVQGDYVSTLCSPSTRQWLSHGRRWLTFNPVDGILDCAAPPAPRHEG
jgi:hypothetical protein